MILTYLYKCTVLWSWFGVSTSGFFHDMGRIISETCQKLLSYLVAYQIVFCILPFSTS